jgi:hypothetical protein
MARGALALAAVALLVAGEEGTKPSAEESAPPSSRPTRLAPAPPDVDLQQIRNIFRYGDGPRVEQSLGHAATRPPVVDPVEASPPPRTRLVGLVERGGQRAAALSIDGEVVILGEGDSSSGFTVLVVGDEAVGLRGPEGEEETLRLP